MARSGLIKVEKLNHWSDSVFGEFLSDAPQGQIANALDLVESAYGTMENVIRVLEAAGYSIQPI